MGVLFVLLLGRLGLVECHELDGWTESHFLILT